MGRWLNITADLQRAATSERPWSQTDPRDRYRILRAYYDSNDLYEVVSTGPEHRAGNISPLKPLRNPTHQVVEFYVTTVCRGQLPDDLPINPLQNDGIVEPIHDVWQWSNWQVEKQKSVRWMARDGDLVGKVAQSDDGERVFIQLIDAATVTDFEKDRRGNLTMIRIDVPGVDEAGRDVTTTELWEKASDDPGADLNGQPRMRKWTHEGDHKTEIETLGEADEDVDVVEEFGIDFIPFAHAPFIDTGEARGRAAIEPALDKIDEANRKATRLSKQQFRHNDVTWALESDVVDGQGRPMPPPEMPDEKGSADEYVSLGSERFLKIPSGWHLQATVPTLDYASALAALQDDMHEMERDLPELTYFRLRDQELSGRAIRLKLGEAISRAEEVQGNYFDWLSRLHKMALTIGQLAGLEGFDRQTIGTYAAGDFEHTFVMPDIIPLPRAERVEILAQFTQAGIPVVAAMRMAGYTDVEVADVEAAIAAEQARQLQLQTQGTLQALRDIQNARTIAGGTNGGAGGNGAQTQTEPIPASTPLQ